MRKQDLILLVIFTFPVEAARNAPQQVSGQKDQISCISSSTERLFRNGNTTNFVLFCRKISRNPNWWVSGGFPVGSLLHSSMMDHTVEVTLEGLGGMVKPGFESDL